MYATFESFHYTSAVQACHTQSALNLFEAAFVSLDVARSEAAQVLDSYCQVVGGLPPLHETLHERLHFVACTQDVLADHLPRGGAGGQCRRWG